MTSLRQWSQPSLKKIVSLSLANRAVEFFEYRHHVFPNFALLTGRLVSQQIRLVIGDHEWGVERRMPLTAKLTQYPARAEQSLHRRSPQSDQDPPVHEYHFLQQTH